MTWNILGFSDSLLIFFYTFCDIFILPEALFYNFKSVHPTVYVYKWKLHNTESNTANYFFIIINIGR
jgi:hypothetical protein